MGVKSLEKFIREQDDSNIFQEIDIRREIEQWRRSHGSNPTIIIDLKEVVRQFFRIDEGGLILGGRYQKFNEIMDYFFLELKKTNAVLVFVLRLTGNKSNFRSIFPAYDYIIRYKSLKFESDGELLPTERILYNFVPLIPKYGELQIYQSSGKSRILEYARENQENVMALITRNTEFLVHEGNFQYWSLSDIQYCELKIAKFCRRKLNEMFDLNVHQWQLLSAISQLEPKIKDQLIGGYQYNYNRLPRLAEYVKNQEYGPNGYELSELSGDLTKDQRDVVEAELDDLLLVNNYTEDEEHELILDLTTNDESFKFVSQFCKKNIYFAYKLMNKTSGIQKDLLFIDVRRLDAHAFIALVLGVTMKLCGIIFKDVEPDKQPKTRTVKINRTCEEDVETEEEINYPTMPLPSLRDLITEEEDKSIDKSRWSLFKWLLDLTEDSILKIYKSKKNLRIVLLTLEFLLSHGIITSREADVLLLTESDCRTKGNVYRPKNFCPPPPMPNTRYPNYVDISWVQTAHKYTISFELVCHCLELCGLRKETDIIELDACKFHENMNVVENGIDSEKIERMMARIKDIRLWD